MGVAKVVARRVLRVKRRVEYCILLDITEVEFYWTWLGSERKVEGICIFLYENVVLLEILECGAG